MMISLGLLSSLCHGVWGCSSPWPGPAQWRPDGAGPEYSVGHCHARPVLTSATSTPSAIQQQQHNNSWVISMLYNTWKVFENQFLIKSLLRCALGCGGSWERLWSVCSRTPGHHWVSLKHQSGSRARPRGTAIAEALHEGFHHNHKPQLCLHTKEIWLNPYQVNFETCH